MIILMVQPKIEKLAEFFGHETMFQFICRTCLRQSLSAEDYSIFGILVYLNDLKYFEKQCRVFAKIASNRI